METTGPDRAVESVDAPAADEEPGRWKRLHTRLHANRVTGLVTKIVLTIVGSVVILVGIVLSGPGVPGPGFLVILLGLAILATEYDWAERLLRWGRAKAEKAAEHARNLDPAVRRRRIALTLLAAVVVVGLLAWYVAAQGWPEWSTRRWDRVQGLAGFVPELPGM